MSRLTTQVSNWPTIHAKKSISFLSEWPRNEETLSEQTDEDTMFMSRAIRWPVWVDPFTSGQPVTCWSRTNPPKTSKAFTCPMLAQLVWLKYTWIMALRLISHFERFQDVFIASLYSLTRIWQDIQIYLYYGHFLINTKEKKMSPRTQMPLQLLWTDHTP